MPQTRVARSETRQNLDLFPGLWGAPDSRIAQFYGVRLAGHDRVAGFDADVVDIVPADGFRFGYRIWSERRTGLTLKLQTLQADGQTIEQTAFTQLDLDAELEVEAVSRNMVVPVGYRHETAELEPVDALSQGWGMRQPVAGFRPVSCYLRSMGAKREHRTMQWTFTDGLAAVSLFVQQVDGPLPEPERLRAMGATHTLTRSIQAGGKRWWLTVVGEVPPQTLDAFAQALVRNP